MKELAIFIFGYLLGLGMQDAQAQTYVITAPSGQVQGYIQQTGQTVNVKIPGVFEQNYTAYPNQLTTTNGAAIGTPSYTIPPVPPTPPSPRVIQ